MDLLLLIRYPLRPVNGCFIDCLFQVNVYATQQMILPVATVDAFQQTGFVTMLMTAKMGAMKLPIVDLDAVSVLTCISGRRVGKGKGGGGGGG